jgi:hypothetical protein
MATFGKLGLTVIQKMGDPFDSPLMGQMTAIPYLSLDSLVERVDNKKIGVCAWCT